MLSTSRTSNNAFVFGLKVTPMQTQFGLLPKGLSRLAKIMTQFQIKGGRLVRKKEILDVLR